MNMSQRYSLEGVNGNAYSILSYVTKAMRKEGKSSEEIRDYEIRAKSGDYDNLVVESTIALEDLNDEIRLREI